MKPDQTLKNPYRNHIEIVQKPQTLRREHTQPLGAWRGSAEARRSSSIKLDATQGLQPCQGMQKGHEDFGG